VQWKFWTNISFKSEGQSVYSCQMAIAKTKTKTSHLFAFKTFYLKHSVNLKHFSSYVCGLYIYIHQHKCREKIHNQVMLPTNLYMNTYNYCQHDGDTQ